MNITAEEKLMYEVMKAVYDSGIPINFKGSMVLKACLIEAGYPEDTRHTVDIDANWHSDTPPSAEQMTESLQNAIDDKGIGLDVRLYRMYGERRSAGFELADRATGETIFSMDIDVNRPPAPTRMYEVNGLRFRGLSPSPMIADKISVVSSDTLFRRVKDIVDLYYISKIFDFDKGDILQSLKVSGRSLGDFNGFLHRTEELKHSYEKFRFAGDVNKVPFDEVYQSVKTYIKDILPKERNKDFER